MYVLLGTLIGLQKTGAVFLTQLFLNLVNIALDIYLVTVMHWGISGVAIASVVSEYAALLLAIYLLRSWIFSAWKNIRYHTTLGAGVLAANAILIQLLHICAYALDGFAHSSETLAGSAWGQH